MRGAPAQRASSWDRKKVRIEVDLLTGLHSGAFDAYSRGLEAAVLGVMMLPAARWNGFHPYRSRREHIK
jgi:hypothetical protein